MNMMADLICVYMCVYVLFCRSVHFICRIPVHVCARRQRLAVEQDRFFEGTFVL